MKKRQLAALFLAAASLLALCALAGCAGRGESRTEDDPLDLLAYSVWERLDRQNDVYFQAARLADDYLSSEERDTAEARFQGFCQGVNAMAQDQIIYNQVNAIFQGQDTLKKAVKQLVTATLTCKLDELTLKVSDMETFLDDVSAAAYDKAVEVVADVVRTETRKEDMRMIEDTKKWCCPLNARLRSPRENMPPIGWTPCWTSSSRPCRPPPHVCRRSS